jgi:hypothetical protein
MPPRRSRILVDRSLQWSLCRHMTAAGALVLIAVSAGLFGPLLHELGTKAGSTPPSEGAEQAIVMVYLHQRFWFVAAACLVLILLGGLRMSHRIAGPLVRFKRNLRLLGAGKLPPPLRTRPRDYLKEEVACLNAAVAGIATRLEAVRSAHANLRRAVVALTEGPGRAVLAPDAIAAAHASNLELERALAAFEALGELDAKLHAQREASPAVAGAEGGAG